MTRLILSLSLALLAACGQLPFYSSDLDHSRSESSVEFVEQKLGPQIEVVSINRDFESFRRLEKNLPAEPRSVPISAEEAAPLAKLHLESLFPGIELDLKSVDSTPQFLYLNYDQRHLGRRIVGATLHLRMDSSGDWTTVQSHIVDLKHLPRRTTTSEKLGDLSFVPEGHQVFQVESVFYPRVEQHGLEVYAAQELTIFNPERLDAYIIWQDEVTQNPVGVYQPQKDLRGSAELGIKGSFIPGTNLSETAEAYFPFVQFQIGGQKYQANTFGRFNFFDFLTKKAVVTLDSPFVSVVNQKAKNNRLDLLLTEDLLDSSISLDDFSSIEERNIYYWVSVAYQYLVDELGFDGMDSQLIAMANMGIELDNAFFNPLLGTLGFGEGKIFFKNTALSPDIILHEYGHAVTHKIYGIRTSYEFRAMNEAFSDYFSATITSNPYVGKGAMLDRPYLRTVQSNFKYENFYGGESFHRDGQLFSGALWRLRQSLGRELADQLIHEARLSRASTVREFYRDLRLIDQRRSGLRDEFSRSSHASEIRRAFMAHGLHSEVRFYTANENLTVPWSRASSQCWSTEP